jgi:methionine-rich copper-binding protein CopC
VDAARRGARFAGPYDTRCGQRGSRIPSKAQLWFSGPLEHAFSTVEILDGTGKRVDTGDPQVEGTERNLLQVSVPQLPAGKYRVLWRVLSVDRHVSKGDFSFDIAP